MSISTAFQTDGAVLLHMAYAVDPEIRLFSVDTGRLPQETFELIEQMRERYPKLQLDLLSPDAGTVAAMVKRHGPNLFYRSVENRLLCCQVRKVQPLQRHLAGLDAWITGLRRDQWATRSDIRKIEIDHDHGAIVKLNPLADWTEDEIWEYVREHELPYNALYDKGFTSIGCAPCTRPTEPGEDLRAGRWWWETGAPKECGIHCAIETGGLEHELHALLGGTMTEALSLKGEAREVALAETQTVHAMARDDQMREAAAELLAAVDGGEIKGGRPSCSSPSSSSGCSRGASARSTGPVASKPRCDVTPAAARPPLRRLRPRGDGGAERARGPQLDAVTLAAIAPGAFMLAIEAGGRSVDQARPPRRPGGQPRHMSEPRYYMACLDLDGRDCPRRRRRPCGAGEGARPARLRRPRHLVAPEIGTELLGSASSWIAGAYYPDATSRPLPRRRGDGRSCRQPRGLRATPRRAAALQRRRRPRALLLHPPRGAPRGPIAVAVSTGGASPASRSGSGTSGRARRPEHAGCRGARTLRPWAKQHPRPPTRPAATTSSDSWSEALA